MKYFAKDNQHVILTSIAVLFVTGLIIRLVFQPKIPYGFHRDEVGIAYSAYSVLQTGKDEWGRFLPLHFKALGDYPPGVYNYLVAATIPFLGLTELAERMPAIIIGSLMIPLTYILVDKFFKQKTWALIASVFVTFSPWMIVQSRAGSEALVALFFSLCGFIFYDRWTNTKKWPNILNVFLFYFLALYSYNAARLVLPLLHFNLVWLSWKKIKPNEKRCQGFLAVILLAFSVISVFLNSGRRMSFDNTSLFTNSKSEAALQVIFYREGTSGLPAFLSRVFTNKPINFVLTLIRQYLEYFSFNFIFHDAGFHKRYLVPEVGPLLVFLLPLIILSFYNHRLKKKHRRFLWTWILLAPLSGAITVVYVPNFKRSMYQFFPLLILAAVGAEQAINWLKKKRILPFGLVFLLGIYGWNFGFFAKQYLVHAKYETTKHRSYGYRQLFTFTEQKKDNYEQVKIYEGMDTPHLYYLFYTKYPPAKYQQLPIEKKRDLFMKDKPVVEISEYEFNPGECPDHKDIEGNMLYVFKYGCLNDKNLKQKVKLIELVEGPDGMPIFALAQDKKQLEQP